MEGRIKSITDFAKKKSGKTPISVVTCYDYQNAKIVAASSVDCILVGDSAGMVFSGYSNTLPVTIDEMIYHTKAVRRGFDGFIITDMPFLSYHTSPDEAVANAGRIMKESGANAVKLEGGRHFIPVIIKLVECSIPVMGHLGLMPQSINKIGGYKVQGRNDYDADIILQDAAMLQDAGVFSVVLEMVAETAAQKITESLNIPTIGIGAGRFCDGQVLVLNDLLGMDVENNPRYLKKFADLNSVILNALNSYDSEVKNKTFPTENNGFR